ncbi:MAG: type I pullulanase [Cyclobacteriaceae bacterium]|nr:type I pullulanase [Cyclobacteriaceae bacterium]
MSCIPKNSKIIDYDDYTTYSGSDLGLTFHNGTWSLRVWSPLANDMKINFYSAADGDNPLGSESMTKTDNGVWLFEANDITGTYYTLQAKFEDKWNMEVVDPYVKMVGVNGRRAYVGIPSMADPDLWDQDRGPEVKAYTDMIIYELHVRDLSMNPASGITNKGKFLGFTEMGTQSPHGEYTGLSHMKELGITHVHLIPSFDFRSIDEAKLEKNIYNWGYDPLNYNVPEGSYSTDPSNPFSRILEFKKMVATLHQNGIGVILDVVYNHTGFTEESSFNQLVPGYYYRQREDGSFSDASACGNETASERPMMRKFMTESMKYWLEEYHIDGFRVDLMGIHDIETMNQLTKEIKALNPAAFVYGEGWTASSSPLPDSLRAIKANTSQLDAIAVFSDEFRDGLKGHWSDKEDKGFVSGKKGTKESVKFGLAGAIAHPQIDFAGVNYTDKAWAREPWQMMSYVSCHDDMTLWDKLKASNPEAGEPELIEMHKLANTLVMTSQGVPFLHGGVDFLRSKNGVHNSFESPDSINSIKWEMKGRYKDVFTYYQHLIRLRKEHPAFRLNSAEKVRQYLTFPETNHELVLAMNLDGSAVGDSWQTILIYYNGSQTDQVVDVPAGKWTVAGESGTLNLRGFRQVAGGKTPVAARSALLLFQ